MNSKLTEKRDYLFDNLKALMLFLVVIGHILDPYIERQDSLYRYLMQYILAASLYYNGPALHQAGTGKL